jgi:tRNA pseudouridine13 synthase
MVRAARVIRLGSFPPSSAAPLPMQTSTMRLKTRPADFVVKELLRTSLLPRGSHAVYRVRKHNMTTLRLQARMARALHLPHSAVVFPALKDKRSVAIQHASAPVVAPQPLEGDGYQARVVGYLNRALRPSDLEGNRFSIVVRDLSEADARHLSLRMQRIGQVGLPNYFDQQRFGSLAPGRAHIARHILLRDAEGAVRSYLTHRFAGDPKRVRKFKAFAADHWGDWRALFEAAPRPSNYRSVLTYLCDHPPECAPSAESVYRKALNLINRRLLSLYLTAYQSLLWNRIAARLLLDSVGFGQGLVEIAGETLPIFAEFPERFDRGQSLPLPHHRAAYRPDSVAQIAEATLTAEGLAMHDLKPRILTKAYLPRGSRALFLFPRDPIANQVEADEEHEGRSKLAVGFALPRGSYATLVIRALAATRDEKPDRAR